MKRWYLRKDGVGLGPLNVIWLDLWEHTWGLEMSWDYRLWFVIGFAKTHKEGHEQPRLKC